MTTWTSWLGDCNGGMRMIRKERLQELIKQEATIGKLKYKKGEFFIPLPDNEPEFIGRDYGDGKTIDEICEIIISKHLREKENEESKN